jgi:hypothetical protein
VSQTSSIIGGGTVKLCREAPTMLAKSASKAAGKLSRRTEKKETKQRIKLNPVLRVRKKRRRL